MPKLPLGAYRLEVVRGKESVIAESVIAVLPESKNMDSLSSAIGNHVDFAPPEKAILAGARWTKTWWLSWEHVEPKPGEWKFDRAPLIEGWKKQGMEVLGVLSGPPRRLQDLPDNALPWGWYPPKDYSAMKEYAKMTVENYRGLIHAWELTNEPNSGLHSGNEKSFATAYAKQWRALAEGVREADPNATIVACSFTLEDYPDELLQQVIAVDPGLLELCDVISYHNYCHSPETVERITGRLRNKLKQLGKDLPVWDTEWSPVQTIMPFHRKLPRNLSNSSATPLRAAAMLVEGHVARIGAGVSRSFVYNGYQSLSMSRYEFEMLVEINGAPRPTLVAQAILARMLDGYQFVDREPRVDAWIYRFRRQDGKALTIAWAADTEPKPIPYTVDYPFRAFNLMGNPLSPSGPNTIELGNTPIYILSKD